MIDTQVQHFVLIVNNILLQKGGTMLSPFHNKFHPVSKSSIHFNDGIVKKEAWGVIINIISEHYHNISYVIKAFLDN